VKKYITWQSIFGNTSPFYAYSSENVNRLLTNLLKMKTQFSKLIGVCCALVSLFVLTSGDANAQCTADPGCAADVNSPQYAQVIADDPFCCATSWDSLCASAYAALNGPINPSPECEPDCPGLGNIGQGCNDNNPGTFNDVIQADCTCAGTPYDCQNLNANIGTVCDDGNPGTVSDVVQADCTCSGVPPLGNDLPCDAETVACGDVVAGTTVGTTADVLGICGTSDGTNGGVWYLLTPSADAQITLSFCDGGTTFDSKVRVFTGTCDALSCVGGNDDFCGLQSQLTFDGTAGTPYYILVHGFGSSAGAFSMSITCLEYDCEQLQAFIGDACDDANAGTFDDVIQQDCTCAGTPYDCQNLNANIGSPCNDGDPLTVGDVVLADCTCAGEPAADNSLPCTADPISCGDVVAGNTEGATPDVQPFCGTSDGTGGGLWYEFTPSEGGIITATTCGLSSFDTKIRVYVGACDNFTCVTGNDDACGLQSSVTFPAVEGSTYYILVHGFGSAQGAFSMSLTCVPYDCPQFNGNIGDVCDDGDSTTFDDIIQADCSCVGTPYDCPQFEANIGGFCDANGQAGQLDDNCNCVAVNFTGCTNGTLFGSRTPTCTVQATPILGSWVNEYSNITVIAGATYTFSTTPNANIPVIYVTITDATGANILAFGGVSVVWQATLNGVVRFYSHGSPDCAGTVTGSASSHTRTVTIDCSTVVWDCPQLQANIGSACNDNNPATFNDVIQADCTCAGSPAQTNDTACQAEDIACGASVSGTTLGTTADVLGLCGTTDGTGGGVWYRLNSPNNANVVLTTCGSLFDTKLRVFSGTCDALVCVGGNDDSQACVPLGQSGLLSTVAFTAAANTDYFILVHGFGTASGSYTLNVGCTIIFDCPALNANIGDACDDGDANTENDTVAEDCTCAGTPITGCNVDGGTVSSANQLTQLCKGDGDADLIQLTVTGNVGAGLFGIVRQSDLGVVATNATGLFNIENLPAGSYFAGHVSVDDLSQLAGVTNVNQLSGCFDLSNQLAVTSIQLTGGTISTGGVTQVCGGTVTATRVGNQGPQSRFVLLNQTATVAISINQNGVFNFSSLADGIYRIVSISFTGNVNLGQITPPTLPACVASSNLVTVTKITCPSALLESSPNPTSGTSFVTFSVPTEEYTTLEVYDMSGRKVSELFNGVTESNTEYRLEFNGIGLPNGVYIYRLTNASEVIIEKFMIAK
jgi:hypothetical protein